MAEPVAQPQVTPVWNHCGFKVHFMFAGNKKRLELAILQALLSLHFYCKTLFL